MNYKVLGIRAAKTFVQAFVAVEVAAGSGYLSLPTIKGAAIAGGAALLSAVQNALAGVETQEALVEAQKAYRSQRP
jgi:hypothetical protein